ncbi:hypothetical protein AMES_0990 [Amycolatopsis mediterranei S699]|uniref:Uncharacterized protein n=2 Tax=Amycolatopsis mediterranei TaxID=33910 RepID=A0A0H3CW11_AMYMU|nr:hypothetical protein [Amycolatopsis mediterranei]AGT81655.1 hypothetical protein B737_0991 [Amycolatopsis mediterranei RB]ADJ42812.1 hypothetical protein AMED_0994 [Amycolatopsis mediterranei U32]AEK39504.1 hypothetical protein RAM_05060 [Amycolatopsis mediterranei S699]AFO74526.1 hypothetical protein AMES_0990 [Amycolatopsis mediterranei S699]KDO09888.1 hypothetical protein DV26_14505 [Amycolatopsis mediterranei]
MAASRPDDGVAVPWLAGVVLAGIGAGLAVVALTFPWISVRTGPRTSSFTLAVTSIERQGPTFAVLLVLTGVGAAVAFAAARRRTGIRWLLVVVCAPVPALSALFVGLRANAADLGSSLPSAGLDPARPDLLVTPAQGLVFYTGGLLFLGLGVAIAGVPAATRIPMAPATAPPPARRTPAVRLTALVLAVPLVVLSQALPWFEIDNTEGDLPAVVTGWPAIYRVGLIATLVLLVATALTTGWRRATLRTTALYVCGGLYGVLLINAWLLWDPTGIANRVSAQRDELALGMGYFAALVAVPLLAVVVGPRITQEPDTEPAVDPEPGEELAAEGQAGPDSRAELEPGAKSKLGIEMATEPRTESAPGAGPAAEAQAGPLPAAKPAELERETGPKQEGAEA